MRFFRNRRAKKNATNRNNNNDRATDPSWSIVDRFRYIDTLGLLQEGYSPTIERRRLVAGNHIVERIQLAEQAWCSMERIETECELGVIYQQGRGDLTDYEEFCSSSLEDYQPGPPTQHFTMEHSQPDWSRAIDWFRAAYQHLESKQWHLSFSSDHDAVEGLSSVCQKQANAAAQIGRMYERGGFGVEQNLDSALHWFIEAKKALDLARVRGTWVTDAIARLSLARIRRQLEEEARQLEARRGHASRPVGGERWGMEYNNLIRQRQDVLNQKMLIKEDEEKENGTTMITETECPCCLETWSNCNNDKDDPTRVVVTMTKCGHYFCKSCVTSLCHMKTPFNKGQCALCRQHIDLSEVRKVKVTLASLPKMHGVEN